MGVEKSVMSRSASWSITSVFLTSILFMVLLLSLPGATRSILSCGRMASMLTESLYLLRRMEKCAMRAFPMVMLLT